MKQWKKNIANVVVCQWEILMIYMVQMMMDVFPHLKRWKKDYTIQIATILGNKISKVVVFYYGVY